jgi:hypothetical protein
MTEVLFLVTTIFVAYVVYVIVNEKKAGQGSAKTAAASSPASQSVTLADNPKTAASKPKAKAPAPKAITAKPAVAAKTAAAKPAPAITPVPEKPAAAAPKAAAVKVAAEKPAIGKTAAKPAAPAKTSAKKAEQSAPTTAPVAAQTLKGSGLKDPKTGEVTTTYSNYRFTKRWIKEALVAEKLVDKVYKNEEINADIDSKIKAGLIRLENMKKYQP